MASPKPDFYVPGAYLFDSPPWPVPALGSNVFLPPAASSSPPPAVAAVAATLDSAMDRSMASLYADLSASTPAGGSLQAKRKRADDSRETTPLAEWQGTGMGMSFDAETETTETTRIETDHHQHHYTLAGPVGSYGADSALSDVAYRRTLGPSRRRDRRLPDHAGAPAPAPPAPWTLLQALGSVVGVVGRVWAFCRGAPFGGFHAGGGVGYDWADGRPAEARPERTEVVPPSVPLPDTRRDPSPRRSPTPDARCRTAKRRQVGTTSEALGRNWVMVNDGRTSDRRAAAHARARAAALADDARGALRVRVSHAGSPRLLARAPASVATGRAGPALRPQVPQLSPTRASPSRASPFRASPSRSLAAQPPISSLDGCDARNPFARAGSPGRSPGRSPVRSPGNPRLRSNRYSVSLATARPSSPSPTPASMLTLTTPGSARGHRRGHSTSALHTLEASPRLTQEARQLAARRVVAERAADAQMEAFNQRVEAMIRLCKETLGTAITIEGDGEEHEGWMDEE